MIKREEVASPTSCLNKSQDDEPIFVLCARDPAFAEAVWAWIRARIRKGLNHADDAKITGALLTIQAAKIWRRQWNYDSPNATGAGG